MAEHHCEIVRNDEKSPNTSFCRCKNLLENSPTMTDLENTETTMRQLPYGIGHLFSDGIGKDRRTWVEIVYHNSLSLVFLGLNFVPSSWNQDGIFADLSPHLGVIYRIM
jgi:hypothetical protein